MADSRHIRIKRVYDPADPGDGFRVLVDRMWPRGLKKDQARVDYWAKDLAPSTALRKWFGHKASKFEEFRIRYLRELDDKRDLATAMLDKAGKQPLTLLYATRDQSCNNAIVLQEFLASRRR